MFNNADTSITDKIAMAQGFKQPFRGSLEMIIGPMFAGKSTELLRRMDRHRFSGKKCLYVKYAEDTRYDVQAISTHD
jgi:thymidine kinase